MQVFLLLHRLNSQGKQTYFSKQILQVGKEAKSNRIDVPVLVGYKLLGDNLGVFIGPVASYNVSTDNKFADFKENATKDFTVGYQFGAQVQLQKLIVTAKYEGAFTEDQRDFINTNTNETIRYDSRPSLFMVGLGYEF